MEPEIKSPRQPNNDDPTLTSQVEVARYNWQRLGMRLRSIGPRDLGRILLVMVAISGVVWLIWQSWQALIPFIAGAFIAYALLPIVNRLDRIMPRLIASLLALTGFFGFFGLLIYVMVPPIAEQIVNVYTTLPPMSEIRAEIADLRTYIETLPEPTQNTIETIADRIAERFRTGVDNFAGNLGDVIVNALLGLFNTVGFILGLLVIPTWLLSVMTDKDRAVEAVNRFLPVSAQPDFWALGRIINRPLNDFIRGQTLIAISVGLLTWVGLVILEEVGLGTIAYKGLLAVIVGLARLIPTIVGTLVGLVPLLIAGFNISPQMALGMVASFVVVQWIVNSQIAERIERRIVGVHPAILVVAIVAVSELGLLWVFLAAPLTAIIRDVFRYVYGRLSEPPRPAGILPGEEIPKIAEDMKSEEQSIKRVPLAYRHGKIPR